MATINFDTSNKNFREILGNGLKYQVLVFSVIMLGQTSNGAIYGRTSKRLLQIPMKNTTWDTLCFRGQTKKPLLSLMGNNG